jgi:hypothetical protein
MKRPFTYCRLRQTNGRFIYSRRRYNELLLLSNGRLENETAVSLRRAIGHNRPTHHTTFCALRYAAIIQSSAIRNTLAKAP